MCWAGAETGKVSTGHLACSYSTTSALAPRSLHIPDIFRALLLQDQGHCSPQRLDFVCSGSQERCGQTAHQCVFLVLEARPHWAGLERQAPGSAHTYTVVDYCVCRSAFLASAGETG